MLRANMNWEPISEQMLTAARRLPVEMKADLEMAYFESIQVTEQSVRDMIMIDSGKIADVGIRYERRSNGADIVIDERRTLPVHAWDARQTPEGVEVDVIRGEPPMLYRKAFLFRGGIYVRVRQRVIKKVADIFIWDWAGPRRMANQMPEGIMAKFGRLMNNFFEIYLGKGTKTL